MSLHGERESGAAKRLRERRMRSWLKHERQTVRMVLAETFHHSSAPFPPKFKEEWVGRHEQHARQFTVSVWQQRQVRTVQTVPGPARCSHRCSSWTSLTCPLFSETVACCWTVPKTVEVPQLPLVQFLEVIDTPVVLVTTGACAGPDSAEFPLAVLDLVHCPSFRKDRCRDGRDSAVNCGGSAVGAHRLACRVDPRHQGGEGVAGTPGACSQVFCHPIRCMHRRRVWRDTHVVHNDRTTTTTTTTTPPPVPFPSNL